MNNTAAAQIQVEKWAYLEQYHSSYDACVQEWDTIQYTTLNAKLIALYSLNFNHENFSYYGIKLMNVI